MSHRNVDLRYSIEIDRREKTNRVNCSCEVHASTISRSASKKEKDSFASGSWEDTSDANARELTRTSLGFPQAEMNEMTMARSRRQIHSHSVLYARGIYAVLLSQDALCAADRPKSFALEETESSASPVIFSRYHLRKASTRRSSAYKCYYLTVRRVSL